MTEPIPFVPFVEALGVRPSPAQRVLWEVIADGTQPEDLPEHERAIARQLFGEVDTIPPELLAVVAIVKGGRIGGSYFAALRLIHLAVTVRLALAPGEQASALIVAPDLRLAKQAFRYVAGAIDSVPELGALEVRRTEDAIAIQREDGQLVAIECLPATRGGSALRGRTLVGVLLDEAAYFRDESAAVNDADIYRAVAPRVVPGGQLLISSTPWAEMGLLFDLFQANHGAPKTCVAARAPTLLMRTDDPNTIRHVERETERDPQTAAQEFGAEFMGRGAGTFFDGAAIDRAIDPTLTIPGPRLPRMAAGVDPGFSRDASAFVATGSDGDRFAVVEVDELRPEKGKPLQPSAVVVRWAELARRLGLGSVLSDVHYRESLREHFGAQRIGLEPVPEGQIGKRAMYERTRALLNEGKLRLPNHPRLIRQLREVIGKPTPGGGFSIMSPRRAGAHGDLVSALVAAVYALGDGKVSSYRVLLPRDLEDRDQPRDRFLGLPAGRFRDRRGLL
jgi:hypothetical protein